MLKKTLKQPNGEFYEGIFKNDKYDGNGVILFINYF